MQLSFDAADRLVELVQARHGPVAAEEAARVLFALEHSPAALAETDTRSTREAWSAGTNPNTRALPQATSTAKPITRLSTPTLKKMRSGAASCAGATCLN